MKYWSREDTRDWISQLENRLEDIDYYLDQTVKWCESQFIHDDRQVFVCSFLTCIWVCHMRNESISYIELLEILGIDNINVTHDDRIYEIGDEFKDIDYEELLRLAAKRLDDF